MDAKTKGLSTLATAAVLLLLAINIQAALLPKCPDSCSPTGIECSCGTVNCAYDQSCGYSDIDGTKNCFTNADIDQCNVRGWVISGRILCIMYLLAPYIVLSMVVLGGVFIILGGDNPAQKTLGKKWIKNAIIGGLIVLALIQFSNAYLNMTLDYSVCLDLGS